VTAPPPAALRVGVLVSGTGTNLQALIDTVHGREAQVVAVASDQPGCPALERARAAAIPVRAFPRAEHADRVARDAAIAGWLEEQGVALVVLAGYMALLSPAFIARFPDRIVNVHPSLLPAFPGLRAIEQALEHGVRVAGVTVHLVDDGVDTGPIILQEAIAVAAGADAETLHAALRPLEHRLLPEAVRLVAAGRVRRDPDHARGVLIDAPTSAADAPAADAPAADAPAADASVADASAAADPPSGA
jgi:phosphoribosylglycinamide formyltransferase-1